MCVACYIAMHCDVISSKFLSVTQKSRQGDQYTTIHVLYTGAISNEVRSGHVAFLAVPEVPVLSQKLYHWDRRRGRVVLQRGCLIRVKDERMKETTLLVHRLIKDSKMSAMDKCAMELRRSV